MKGIVSEECPQAEEVLFVQGNHDMMTDQIAPSGLYESENYLIYILNTEEDFPWKQGKTAGCLTKVRKSSTAMKECFDDPSETLSNILDAAETDGKTIDRVIMCGDYSMDIVYLFGHDHSKGWDCYLGGSSVYKAKGDSVLIPRFEEDKINTDEYSQERLNFTYMNAGYSGYYINCSSEEYNVDERGFYDAADGALTGSVFQA